MSRTGGAAWWRPGERWRIVLLTLSAVCLYTYQPLFTAYTRCHPELAAGSTAVAGSTATCAAQTVGFMTTGTGAFGSVTIGLVLGLILGAERGRRRGALIDAPPGRAVAIGIVVTLGAPTFAPCYLLGYGYGRLRREPRASVEGRVVADQHRTAWEGALRLRRHLLDGGELPRTRPHDFLGADGVYLDTGLNYARYHGLDVTYRTSSVMAFGPPGFVLGAVLVNSLSNASAAARARALAAARWHGPGLCRVLVTDRSTWCAVGHGQWREFPHHAVLQYRVDGFNVVMTFPDVEPMLLSGPAAWLHAVIFARLRLGPHDWAQAPWLEPLQSAELGRQLLSIVDNQQRPAADQPVHPP